MAASLTVEQVRALPAAVDLVTAGRAFGVGRTKAHELARAGEWPTPLLRLGTRYRVRRSDLLELLGIDDQPSPANGSALPDAGARAMAGPQKPLNQNSGANTGADHAASLSRNAS